jgi:hypothetical protein
MRRPLRTYSTNGAIIHAPNKDIQTIRPTSAFDQTSRVDTDKTTCRANTTAESNHLDSKYGINVRSRSSNAADFAA